MPAVPLPPPLWWVTRRLRQFLTALAMLVLAFGASAALAPGPASSPARPVAVAATPTAEAGTTYTAEPVTAGVAARPAASAAPGKLRGAEPGESGSASGLAAAPVMVPPQPLVLGSAKRTGHPTGTAGGAVAGQRAPPHS